MTSNIPSRRSWVQRCALGAAGVGALVAAGCSSSSSGGGGDTGGAPSTAAAGNGGQAAAMTVSVRSAGDLSNVLTDSKGRTLYTSDQEANGKLLCTTSDCTAIWTPLTVSAGQKPSAPSSVMGKLTTIKRPDGKTQVALDGQPLYTFSFDHGAGEVNGNGTKDSFNGTDFTWHAATASGLASAPSSSSDNGGGYGGGGGGGYGY